ncbi:MAG: 1-acyl-sn-glycerol-3-phosphate acyltransferase [Bacilli bacterium]|nr:1-acyl-sn-glycerol-3-phosphate acyltransferase [Bacilli bacterium]
MIIELFVFLCGVALATTGSLTFWPVTHWWDFYIPIVLFIAGYLVALFGIVWVSIDIAGRIIALKKDRNGKVSHVARWIFMQGIHYIIMHAGIRYRLRGVNKLPRSQKFLLVCNHRSKFDSFLISDYLGKYDIGFVTKMSNMKIPLGPRLMNAMDYLPVDRDDKLQSLEMMKKGANILAKGQSCIGVFPEGTRQQEKIIGEFHEGVFNMALHARVPIVVMTTWGTDRIAKNWPWKFTRVKQDILCTIPYEEIADKPAREVSDMVKEMMIEHLTLLKEQDHKSTK